MFIYYILVALLLCVVGPLLLLSPKRRVGLKQKLGCVPNEIRNQLGDAQGTVWFHSVSVGEFNAAWPLIQAFMQEHPKNRIVISTATATGQKLARERAADKATIIYFPLDLPFAMKPWLEVVSPKLVVIVETELWPGFTHECKRRGIPVLVVNGRISLRSFKRYLLLRSFFAPVLRRLSAIAVQSSQEAQRYCAIGGNSLPVSVLGNLKYDGLKPIGERERADLASDLNLSDQDVVIIGGSTHETEETALLSATSRLVNANQPWSNKIRLIIAPRHPERYDRVACQIEAAGFRVRRYSKGQSFESNRDVYMLDTIGQLFKYYSLSTIAFVGGTLAPIGGHNLLEPAAYGVPVICGPNLFKTADSAQSLVEHGALTIIKNPDELYEQINKFIQTPSLAQQMGNAARDWLLQSQGSVSKTLRLLNPLLKTDYNTERSSLEPHTNGTVKI